MWDSYPLLSINQGQIVSVEFIQTQYLSSKSFIYVHCTGYGNNSIIYLVDSLSYIAICHDLYVTILGVQIGTVCSHTLSWKEPFLGSVKSASSWCDQPSYAIIFAVAQDTHEVVWSVQQQTICGRSDHYIDDYGYGSSIVINAATINTTKNQLS